MFWILYLANDATVGSTELTYDEARAQDGIMPAYITAIDIPYPYPSQFGKKVKGHALKKNPPWYLVDFKNSRKLSEAGHWRFE